MVWDYTLANGTHTDYTLYGQTTYYVSGAVILNGTTTIEGGTVVKFAPYNANNYVQFNGTVNCLTDPYRPAIFTARDDNTVGETISGSTGTPSGYYAATAISLWSSSTPAAWALKNFRISHAQQAVKVAFSSAFTLFLNDGQLVNCANGINIPGQGSVYLRNLLFANVQTALNNPAYVNIIAENTTFGGTANYPGFLVTGNSGNYPFSVNLKNCIIARIITFTSFGSQGSLTGDHNGFWNNSGAPFGTSPIVCPTGQNPFQPVGAGNYYLAETDPRFRDAGTWSIDSDLLRELKTKTTYPPLVQSDPITDYWVFEPQATRDTAAGDLPDLGYHYEPLDWAVNYVSVSAGVTVQLQPDSYDGVAIGLYGALEGLRLGSGARLESLGTAVRRNRFARYSVVQEQPICYASLSLWLCFSRLESTCR